MAHCPSQDWDRYVAGQEDMMEAEMQRDEEMDRLRAALAASEARAKRLEDAILRIRAFPSVRTSGPVMDVILAALAEPAADAGGGPDG